MTNGSSKKLWIPLIAILSVVFFPFYAFAVIITVQPEQSSSVLYDDQNGVVGSSVTYLPNVSGIVKTILLELYAPSGANNFAVIMFQCNSLQTGVQNVFTNCTQLFSSTTPVTALGLYGFSTSTNAMTLEASKYHYLYLGRSGDGNEVYVYGTNASTTFTTYAKDGVTGAPITATTTPFLQLQSEQFDTNNIIETSSANTFVIETLPCGITDLSGCFKNAVAWAFYPSADSFVKFSTLADQLKDRAPFGYFTSGKNALLGLNATSSTPAYTLATSSPIMATIFTPLRTGLTWVFLFGGVVWIYKRVTHVNV